MLYRVHFWNCPRSRLRPACGHNGGACTTGRQLHEAAQNPIADLISLSFQNNTNFDIGRSENTQNVLNIQPVYPVDLNQTWA